MSEKLWTDYIPRGSESMGDHTQMIKQAGSPALTGSTAGTAPLCEGVCQSRLPNPSYKAKYYGTTRINQITKQYIDE